MQTSTFGLKFDSLRYDVPLKIRSRSSKHKKKTLQTIPMICPNNHLLVHKISCIQREWGEWYANTNIVADKIRTKICPTSSWVGGDQKSSLCLKTNKAKCSSPQRMAEKGEIKLSFATIECNVWQNAGIHFSLLCSKLLCILFAHTCIWSIMIYVPISCKMPCEWRNSFNLVDLYP